MRYGTRWKRRGEKKTQPCHINKLENNFPTCYILPTPTNSLPCTSHSGKTPLKAMGKKSRPPHLPFPACFFLFLYKLFFDVDENKFPHHQFSLPFLFVRIFSLFFVFKLSEGISHMLDEAMTLFTCFLQVRLLLLPLIFAQFTLKPRTIPGGGTRDKLTGLQNQTVFLFTLTDLQYLT